VNLSRLRGPLVVNLFAQWCGPCREEMPFYQKLHQQAGGRVKVLGIDYLDTQPGRALDLVKQSGVTYPLLADPAGNLRAPFRVRGLPGVLLIDRSGRVRDLEFTVVSSYGQLRRLVHRHLGVSP
jgi:thiol-disulfide isomerase/thioredoxin